MKIIFHGAGQEVGRSAIEIKSKDTSFLFDCGVKLTANGVVFPYELDSVSNSKYVFLSHAHLDHSGALALLYYYGFRGRIFATRMTKELSKILLFDSYKISKIEQHHVAYNRVDIKKVLGLFDDYINYNKTYQLKDLSFKVFDAGHIPGSSSFLVNLEKENKSIFYTGDINNINTNLLNGYDYDNVSDVDLLIIESTYGNRDHPLREESVDRFKQKILERLPLGPVLLPVFAVGRAQEIAMIVTSMDLDVPIYFNGMAKKVLRLFLEDSKWITNKEELEKTLDRIHFVDYKDDLDKIANEHCIMITTSGMMAGGPVMGFLEKIYHNPNATILLTGYQAEDTNGRYLLDTGYINLEGDEKKVDCYFERFDFSGHAGQEGLINVINKLNPKKVIVQHGDPEAIIALAEYCKNKRIETYTPRIGDSYNFD